MAQSAVDPAVDPTALTCSLCLEELKEPVPLPCGHNYCGSCVRKHQGKSLGL
uniref:RING-type domain-containing protein n=1 Tax=Periophthalmus magnuspinnatus TaxID=409849 RepID=A0A3B3Z9M3_9GOBI